MVCAVLQQAPDILKNMREITVQLDLSLMIVYGVSEILKAEIAQLLTCIYNKGCLYQL